MNFDERLAILKEAYRLAYEGSNENGLPRHPCPITRGETVWGGRELPHTPTERGFYLPSNIDDLVAAFRKAGLKKGDKVVDLGGGDAIVGFVASLFGAKAAVVEILPELVKFGKEMKNYLAGKIDAADVDIRREDMFQHDVSDYDLLFYAENEKFDRGKRPSQTKSNHARIEELLEKTKPGARVIQAWAPAREFKGLELVERAFFNNDIRFNFYIKPESSTR